MTEHKPKTNHILCLKTPFHFQEWIKEWETNMEFYEKGLLLFTFFLHSSSICSCHLFSISSASVRSLPFLSFIMFILAWNVSLISPIFLKKSLHFLILLFFLISLHCSFKNAFLPFLAILWNFTFSCIIFPFLSCLFLLFFLSYL